jgi:hypothetical protein
MVREANQLKQEHILNSLIVLSFLPASQQRSGFLLSYSPIRNYRTYVINTLIIRSYQVLGSRCSETRLLEKNLVVGSQTCGLVALPFYFDGSKTNA